MRNYTRYLHILTLGTVLMLVGCNNGGSSSSAVKVDDTTTSGTIRISVDESFKPVIDSQIKVFQASFPDAHIIAEYKPEAECLKDLESDSTRMVIVTRGLSEDETKQFEAKLGFRPAWGVLAYDAVAVIANKKSKDSTFRMSDIKDMLAGTSNYKYKVVMDGVSATSTVRFALDSLLRGKKLGANVVAKKTSPEVISYVESDPEAIGMIGVSWIGNSDDAEQLSFLGKVRVAALACETCDSAAYTRPYQANIALGRYPLIRSLNYILKENYQGLGKGFVNFLIYERGQLIFKRAYLLPGRMQFEVRNMSIKQ
ncbi:MAG TPA: substrate-binding domain-containing protein [Phnomibacter sp.]|nr:substrate-binding domain-containing protein [Phnomibacter sp.]